MGHVFPLVCAAAITLAGAALFYIGFFRANEFTITVGGLFLLCIGLMWFWLEFDQ